MSNLHLPDYTLTRTVSKLVKPRQRTAKLPSWGIEQRGTRGQNQTSPEWSVRWILAPIEANTLDFFLAQQAKTGAWFLWTPPESLQGRFRCDDWTKQLSSCNIWEVQATFRQIYSFTLPSLGASTGYFALSLGDVTRAIPFRVVKGNLTLVGNQAALVKTTPIFVAPGAFVLTGTGITVARSWRLGATAGSFVLIGNDAALVEVEQLFAAPAAFALAGADVSFSLGGSPTPPSTTDESSFWSDWAFASSDIFLYEEGAAAATGESSFWSTWQDWIEESALLLE